MTLCRVKTGCSAETRCDLVLDERSPLAGLFIAASCSSTDAVVDRSLVVHGFVMDEYGKKMSKSLGNVVDPDAVVNGGKVC